MNIVGAWGLDMKTVVKPRNKRTFQIWLEKLGYSVKALAAGGFTALTNDRSVKKRLQYVRVDADLGGNEAAFELGRELEMHLVSPDLSDEQHNGLIEAMVN